MYTEEQKQIYKVIMAACTAVENKRVQEAFFKETIVKPAFTLLEGLALLIAIDKNLNDEILTACKEQDKFTQLLVRLSVDHPALLYLDRMKDLTPRQKSSVELEVRLVIHEIREVLKKVKNGTEMSTLSRLLLEEDQTKEPLCIEDTREIQAFFRKKLETAPNQLAYGEIRNAEEAKDCINAIIRGNVKDGF